MRRSMSCLSAMLASSVRYLPRCARRFSAWRPQLAKTKVSANAEAEISSGSACWLLGCRHGSKLSRFHGGSVVAGFQPSSSFHSSTALYDEVKTVVTPGFPESVAEGDVRWEKAVGDFVGEDESVGEIETDKTSLALLAPASGIIEELLVPDGGKVVAGQEIYKLKLSGDAPAKKAEPAAEKPAAAEAAAPAPPPPSQPSSTAGPPPSSPPPVPPKPSAPMASVPTSSVKPTPAKAGAAPVHLTGSRTEQREQEVTQAKYWAYNRPYSIGNLALHKKLQTSANLYVFNLALADLIMCMGNFPLLIVSSFAGRWTTGFTGCKIYSFLGGLAGFVSINTLTAMACDRYNILCRTKGLQEQRSKKPSLGLIVSLWIYSLLWAMPPFFGWGHFALGGGQISCCFDYLNRSASNVSYIIAIFVFCFSIQMLVICFCYGNIVLAVCRNEQAIKRANMDILLYQNHSQHSMQHLHNNHRQATAPPTAAAATFAGTEEERAALSDPAHHNEDTMTVQQLRKRRRLDLRVTRQVVFITASFCLSWTPFAVVSLIGAFGNASVVTPIVSVLPGILAKIATVVNPLLYAIGHPQYRNVIFKRSHTRAGQGG